MVASLRGGYFIFLTKELPMFDGPNNSGWDMLGEAVDKVLREAPKVKFKHYDQQVGVIRLTKNITYNPVGRGAERTRVYSTTLKLPHDLTLRNGISVIALPIGLPNTFNLTDFSLDCDVFIDRDDIRLCTKGKLTLTVDLKLSPHTTVVIKGGRPFLSLVGDALLEY